MQTNTFVMFYRIGNRIKHILPYLQLRFQKSDVILTIVRIHPHAVLESNKTDFTHKIPQSDPDATAPFWDIKNNHPPSSVPFLLLILERSLRLFESKRFMPSFSETQEFLAVFFNPCSVAFDHHASSGCTCPVC